MTRSTDPYAHTELRDLVSPYTHPSSASSSNGHAPTIYPTYVLPANMTTIHPQLRDLLVCPGERGRVYYIQGKGVMCMKVDLEGEEEYRQAVREGRAVVGEWNPKRTYQEFSRLPFTPNCLTTSSTLLACGGQNGELHLTTLPSSSSSSSSASSSAPTLDRPLPRGPNSTPSRQTGSNSNSRRTQSHAQEERWSMTMTLPNTSINNSFLLLPAYRGNTPLPTRPSSPSNNAAGSTFSSSDGYRSRPAGSGLASGSGSGLGSTSTARRAGQSNGRGVATYPNSVQVEGDDGGARYATTGTGVRRRFGGYEDVDRGFRARYGSTGSRARSHIGEEEPAEDDDAEEDEEEEEEEEGQMDDEGWTAVGPSSATRGHRPEEDHRMEHDWEGFDTIFPPAATNRSGFSPAPYPEQEPRWVTEAIDGSRTRMAQTTFSGPSTARPSVAPWERVVTMDTEAMRRSEPRRNLAWGPVPHDRRVPRHIENAWEAAALTYHTTGQSRPTRARPSFRSTIEYESTHSPIREDEPRLLVSNNDMSVKLFAIRNASATQTDPPLRWGEIQNKGPRKKLANIGGTKFDTAVNHASVSPDGTTMLVVGDTNDVFLYEVRGGGREFSKIARYEGSRDAGFSTSWSADGRKFVVASQDGQVTVWDHRSSHPLAKLYTSRASSRSTVYGMESLYWSGASEPDSPTPYVSPTTLAPPSRTAAPASPGRASPGRRDPARVVKFSPAGSGRELLVFSEESDHIHIADARTFDSQITVRVPLKATFGQTIWNDDPSHVRTASDRGRVGIAGLCFDEKGDFLYAGTESSIVEYDLRLESKRGSGSISMI